MRALERLSEPTILAERGQQWLNIYLSSGKKRPDSKKYAHKAIKAQLNSMSYHKCFYCESKLKGIPNEVDHHIEISINKKLSYTWTNLYLSCDNCNGKLNHNEIPIETVLDPCVNTDEEIQAHLIFEKEMITARNNSDIGLKTIRKYRLDTELLDLRRLKQLNKFQSLLIAIQQKQIADGGRALNTEEISTIKSFAQRDHPYSLMFEFLIKKINI
jgi:hypothetical protein